MSAQKRFENKLPSLKKKKEFLIFILISAILISIIFVYTYIRNSPINPDKFPVDLNSANYDEMLHTPGIGERSAKRIWSLRHHNKIDSMEELKNMGIVLKRAKNFIKVGNKIQSNLNYFS